MTVAKPPAELTGESRPGATLRQRVMRGGALLALRHGLGTAINLIGVLLLIRRIGATQYGVYAAALGFVTTLQLLSRGIGIYLVRSERTIPKEEVDQASTLVFLLSIASILLGVATLPLIQTWTRIPNLGPVTMAMYAGLPVVCLAQVPLAMIERGLDYRKLVGIELLAQSLFFVVAIPAAYADIGSWAPAAGWWVQQVASLLLCSALVGYRARWRWDGRLARDMISYSSGYTSSLWVASARRLVNPLVVGRYLGAEAVAVVAVTTQIANQLAFVAAATWRLTPAALGRVQSEGTRLARVIDEAIPLQILLTAPFMILFGWLSGVLIPPMLGTAWTPIAMVYPYIALAHLVNTAVSLHATALYVLKRTWEVTLYNTVQVVILAGATMVLVPRMGLAGYGVAEIASLASFVVLHAYTARAIGVPAYARALPLLLAGGLGLFWHPLGMWSVVGMVLVLAITRPWEEARQVFRALIRFGSGKDPS